MMRGEIPDFPFPSIIESKVLTNTFWFMVRPITKRRDLKKTMSTTFHNVLNCHKILLSSS